MLATKCSLSIVMKTRNWSGDIEDSVDDLAVIGNSGLGKTKLNWNSDQW